jgi:hypothetical protein
MAASLPPAEFELVRVIAKELDEANRLKPAMTIRANFDTRMENMICTDLQAGITGNDDTCTVTGLPKRWIANVLF